jgi:MYXO-CTERM domain-containing protein
VPQPALTATAHDALEVIVTDSDPSHYIGAVPPSSGIVPMGPDGPGLPSTSGDVDALAGIGPLLVGGGLAGLAAWRRRHVTAG